LGSDGRSKASSLAALVVLAVAALTLAVLRAQAPVAPAIQGTVTDVQAATVPDMRVVLFPADPSTWSAPNQDRFLAVTVAADGAYQFARVPPGQYRLAVLDAATFGRWPAEDVVSSLAPRAYPLTVQTAPLSFDLNVNMATNPPVLVSVSSLTTARGLAAPLPAGVAVARPGGPPGTGVAAGRVFDEDKRPVSGVEIRIYSYRTMSGVSQLVMMMAPGSVKTDEQGAYRFSGLRPGMYFIGVPAHVFVSRGPGLTASNGLPASITQPDRTKLGYGYTFYPSATTSREATQVRIETGEQSDLDVTLRRQRLVDVAGRVTGGRVLAAVSLVPADPAEGFGGSNQRRVAPEPDGSFMFPDVPLGEYTISATSLSGAVRSPINITGALSAPVELSLRPGIVIAGRVEFVGAPPPAAAPADLRLAIRLIPVSPNGSQSGQTVPIEGSSFRLNNVQPGRYRLDAVLPPPWRIASALLNDVDTMDTSMEIAADGAAPTARVVVVAGETWLDGTVRRNGAPPPATSAVVVFPEEEAGWTAVSRRVRVARPGPAGLYSVTGLPPGRYLVATVERAPANLTAAPTAAMLRSLAPRAVKVELALGAPTKLDLTLDNER
jgi:hypothetical protein